MDSKLVADYKMSRRADLCGQNAEQWLKIMSHNPPLQEMNYAMDIELLASSSQ